MNAQWAWACNFHVNQFQACYPLNLDEIGWLKSYSLHLIKLLIEINGDSAWASTATLSYCLCNGHAHLYMWNRDGCSVKMYTALEITQRPLRDKYNWNWLSWRWGHWTSALDETFSLFFFFFLLGWQYLICYQLQKTVILGSCWKCKAANKTN